MKLKCDWCPNDIKSVPVHGNARRRFCSKACKKAHEDFQQRIYDPVRIYPTVERNADV
jgi:hypothetical protein